MAEDDNQVKKPSVPLTELGGTGLRNTGGHIDEEIICDLRFPNSVQVYRQMETDALISGALFAIKQFIRSAEWTVEEYSGVEAPDDTKEQKLFLEQCLGDLSKTWGETLTDILSFLSYGFSVHEIVYKRRLGRNAPGNRESSKFNDGKVGWSKFPIRSQDTIEKFNTTKKGDLESVEQHDYWNQVKAKIPADRFILFRTSSYKDNPHGQSILRGAYRAYYFRKNLEMLESIGYERNLAGIPVIRVPHEILSADADDDEKALRRTYETMGKLLKKNEQSYVMLPSDIRGNGENGSGEHVYDISLLKSDGANTANISPVIERYDRRILQSMLADVLLVGGQSVGSYSLASTKADMFTHAISSYLDVITEQFNDKAIPLLWEMNGWDASKAPRLKHTGLDKIDIQPLADLLDKAGKSGFIQPDDGIENYLRDAIGVPHAQTEGDGSVMERARAQAEIDGLSDV